VLVIGVMAVVPLRATAQTSDVTLTVFPAAYLFDGVAVVQGEVSCSSTLEVTESVSATIRQSGAVVDSSFGFAFCDPASGLEFDGLWTVLFESSQLRPGKGSVTVHLTLDNGAVVSATGSSRLVNPNSPFFPVERVDDTYIDQSLSSGCGFPVQAHDVGRAQVFFFRDATAERFVGSTTYTNLDSGTSVLVETSARIRISDAGLAFTGLNYRIRTSSGQLVSAGRGVLTVEGETATPHLTHLSEVICGLLE
jgi:hypothetical protein